MTVNTANHMPGVPLVSIILIAFDGNVQFLRRAALSLQEQTLQDFEVILGYDGCLSDDQAESEIIDQAFHGVPYPVRVFDLRKKNGYQSIPRNRVTPMGLGAYVINMDADNEFGPEHLEELVKAIRTPDEFGRRPDFVYSRRTYIKDPQCKKKVVEGPSALIEWRLGKLALAHGPKYNFLDTGDMLIPMSALHTLAIQTGEIWGCNDRRHADYHMAKRMAKCGMEGRAVDITTNWYHWTGGNVQLVSGEANELVTLPESWYEKLIASGQTIDQVVAKEQGD
jgi:hypothetical protein